MSRKFECKFFNCSVHNLPPDEKGTCSPFVKVEIETKQFFLPKKKKTLNPEWPNFAVKFPITIKKGISVRDRKMVVTVWKSKGFNKKEKIGHVSVDLHTLATGAVNHRLKLLSPNAGEQEDLGTIKFGLKMKEIKDVSVNFKNVKIIDLKRKQEKPKFFLQFSSIRETCKKVDTDVVKGTNAPIWNKCAPVVFEKIGQKSLKEEMMYIFLYNKKGIKKEKLGTAVLEFKKIMKAKMVEKVDYKVNLKDLISQEVIARLEFEVVFSNVPEFAQMIGGEHSNFGTTGDTLFDDSEIPDPPKVQSFDQPKEIKTFITIDLGTTHSGYSYCTHDITDIDKVNIHMSWGDGHYKYKNKSSILYKDEKPVCWGFRAISEYNQKRKKKERNMEDKNDSIDRYTLISDFKLNIALNEPIIKKGKEFPIVKLVGDFLKLMKQDIIDELNKQNYCTDRKYVKYVLTVPAIWSDHDKRIMREGAIAAGILEEEYDDDDHFAFALEPESASLPCLLYDNATIKPKTKFLVLDAGGGTIDIAVYETVKPPDGTKFGIRQLQNASGGASGGKFINDRFLLFLKQNISEEQYQKIIDAYDFNELMTRWEEAKLQFKKENIDDDIFISLPNSINEIIKDIIELEDYYEEDEGDLIIPGELFYEIYKAPVERTVEYVSEELEKLNSPIKYIFMVGGFSESPILFDAIKENYETDKCKVIKTPQPGIRVLQGATWFGKYPRIISSRCSSLTYIAKITKPEDIPTVKGKKNVDKLWFTSGGARINKYYQIMARAGDIIEAGKKFKLECELQGQRGIIQVFATSLPRIKTIGPPECHLLLSIDLKLKKKRKKTRLDVYVIFGDTELKFEVYNPKFGKKIKSSNFAIKFENAVEKRLDTVANKDRNVLSFNNKPKFKPKRRRRRKNDINSLISEKIELPSKN